MNCICSIFNFEFNEFKSRFLISFRLTTFLLNINTIKNVISLIMKYIWKYGMKKPKLAFSYRYQ